MIIVSQNKDMVVNFDNITRVYISQYEEKTANFIRLETVDSIYDDLGQYETEERAKEVLQEIIHMYIESNTSNPSTGYGYVKNKVYEMPKK